MITGKMSGSLQTGIYGRAPFPTGGGLPALFTEAQGAWTTYHRAGNVLVVGDDDGPGHVTICSPVGKGWSKRARV